MVSATGSRYLVTGGAGFIGSHLCDALLLAGHDVVVLDDLSTGQRHNLDHRVELIVGSVTDPAVLGEACRSTNGVFHLAAIASVARSNEDWLGTHSVNQTGTIMVLNAARRASCSGTPVPVVFASSAAVYGDAGEIAVAESAPTSPQTGYGADKLGSELHARVGTLVHGIPTLGFRFFNVYGPRQDPRSPYSGVISIFARLMISGEAVTLHGDGQQARDFVFVGDVVRHLLAGMDAMKSGRSLPPVLNVCTGRVTTVRQLAEVLLTLTASNRWLETGPARAGDIRYSCGSPERSGTFLAIRAETELETGLRILVKGL